MITSDLLTLFGVIPQTPIILCKTDQAAEYIQIWMHNHLTHEPPVIIADQWPEGVTTNAVVITPLEVASGSEKYADFSMPDVQKLSEDGQKALAAVIRLKIADEPVTARNLSKALYGVVNHSSRRKAEYRLRELAEHGFIKRGGERQASKVLFGRWRPDAVLAKASGIKVEEYK